MGRNIKSSTKKCFVAYCLIMMMLKKNLKIEFEKKNIDLKE